MLTQDEEKPALNGSRKVGRPSNLWDAVKRRAFSFP